MATPSGLCRLGLVFSCFGADTPEQASQGPVLPASREAGTPGGEASLLPPPPLH